MEFFDRVAQHPGRVKMTPVPGQTNIYDMERADDPLIPGTPVNKALFDSFNNDIAALRQHVANTLFELSQRVELSALADGALFSLYENGIMTPFIKLKSNYEESGRILVVRLNCVAESVLFNAGEIDYANSFIDLWLNNDYNSFLDAATQSALSEVSVKVSTNIGVSGISRKVFLLSLREYQMTSNEGISAMGSSIGYFADALHRVATFDGAPVNHWTRSNDRNRDKAAYITPDGGHLLGVPSTFTAGIRPAFTLPGNFEVTAGIPSTANTMATAEVI